MDETLLNAEQSVLSRLLGTSERFYWLYDQASCANFVIAAELSNPVDRSKLMAAIEVARHRHPPLRSHIVCEKKSRRVVYVPSPNEPFVIDESGEYESLESEIERQLDRPFTPGSYPLFRIKLLQDDEDEKQNILFIFHHAMIDARSAALAVEDILADTFGDSDEKEDTPGRALEAQERMFPGKFRGFSAALRMIGMLFGELVTTLIGRRPARLPVIDRENKRGKDLKVRHFEFDRTKSLAIIEKCRAETTTIQAAVLAAQFLAIRQEVERSGFIPLGITSAVNLRPYMSQKVDDHEAGMCISMIHTDLCVSGESDFWDLARESRKQLVSRIDKGYGHVLWSAFPPVSLFPPDERGASRLQKFTMSAPQRTIVTNIGRLGERRPAISGSVRSMHFSMGTPIGQPLVTAVMSYDGKLVLNCCVNLAELEEARAERIATSIQRRLMEECGGVMAIQ